MNDPRNVFLNKQLSEFRTCSVSFRSERSGYYAGERVQAQVYEIDGSARGLATFKIGNSPGSGFAGQVYQAKIEDDGGLPGETTPQWVALKVLKPRSEFKRWFRDLLFWFSFQASFAPRLRDEALRSGLLWQAILRAFASVEFKDDDAVVRPIGYFWDPGLRSLVEIHEWVDSSPLRYSPEGQSTHLWTETGFFGQNAMQRKRGFMADLTRLCRRIGATGLSRQYEWYTFVSQANVLLRNRPDGNVTFCAVDCRPGLAVPFFLPISPVHARIIWEGLHRNVLVHYDECDLPRLEMLLTDQMVKKSPEVPVWFRQLSQDVYQTQQGLPALWSRRMRHQKEAVRIRKATCGDWLRLGLISPERAIYLQCHPFWFTNFVILTAIPWLGPFLMRIAGNEAYRRHLASLFHWKYLLTALNVQRAGDLLAWVDQGDISLEHGKRLDQNLLDYLVERITLGWLPGPLHRLGTDPAAWRSLYKKAVLHPVKLVFKGEYRFTWLSGCLQDQFERGVISEAERQELNRQLGENNLERFVRDAAFTASLELFSKVFYLFLAWFGLATGNFLPLGLAALGPVPPSGLLRLGYLTGVTLFELPMILVSKNRRLLAARLSGIASAPWRWVGNLMAPIEAFIQYPFLAVVLGEYFVSEMVNSVPVFGGRGSLLEYTLFRLIFRAPILIQRFVGRLVVKEVGQV